MSTGRSMDRRRFLEGAMVAAGACLGAGSARGATSTDIVSPADFAHLAVRVGDLNEALAFYDTLLRCRPHHVARAPVEAGKPTRGGAWCSYDIEHHRVSIFGRGGRPVPEAGLLGWDRFTFSYDSLTELGANYHALKLGGIEPRAARRYGDSVSLLYTDPSGNRIEMLLDRFNRIEDLEPYLGEAAGLEKSAAGVDFDPDGLPAPGNAASAENETVAPSELVHTVIRTRELEPSTRYTAARPMKRCTAVSKAHARPARRVPSRACTSRSIHRRVPLRCRAGNDAASGCGQDARVPRSLFRASLRRRTVRRRNVYEGQTSDARHRIRSPDWRLHDRPGGRG